ncbi:pilus assembly protein CpaB [Pseudarthrobacter sp. PvP004]|uniref:Flp pilus assembly protein CpaB n=1 Tax=Pseudarthrobacter sp. PvP004 TaxID=2817850 RepID=UPI001AE99235|nr:Flp pilus assembly protein CpaB [Pseudarthrobacter sp. PvP004]MBP2269283.1 pilus assembly protein CpaB [Pseudarthrobacter sp. PvP004]
MKSRLIGGIAALVLAVVGTVLLVNYVSNADRRAQSSLDPVDVVVVDKPVPAGTSVQELSSLVQIRSVPSAAKADGALTTLDTASGQVTSVALEPGEQLLGSRLIDPTERIMPGAVPVPEGMQEVTILLPPESVVGGTVRAGDLVGLFVTQTDPNNAQMASTQLVFDKVLVTAIQQAPTPPDTTVEGTSSVPSGASFVTLARTSTDAAKVILSARVGNIWLTKQSATTPESPKTTVSTAGIFQ